MRAQRLETSLQHACARAATACGNGAHHAESAHPLSSPSYRSERNLPTEDTPGISSIWSGTQQIVVVAVVTKFKSAPDAQAAQAKELAI
mgnify:CR=1 FL=1